MLVPVSAATDFTNAVTSADLKINALFGELSVREYSPEESLSEIHTSLATPLSEFLLYVCVKKSDRKGFKRWKMRCAYKSAIVLRICRYNHYTISVVFYISDTVLSSSTYFTGITML